MSIKNLTKCFLLVTAALVWAVSGNAQTTFENGKLYHIYASGNKDNVVYQNGVSVGLGNYEDGNTAQFWKISELSGSWRIINPVTNQALRANGNKVEVGENNGSDEAQLWKFEDGLLIPANNPSIAVVKHNGGLAFIAKDRAATINAAKFRIEESKYAGFDDNLTYRILSVANEGTVLGNNDSGENNSAIVGEAVDADNRGQYWNIKTIDTFTFAVENAFYGQNFDDGGGNASIDYLLQWPATAGVWNNAKFRFEPVEGEAGTYLIVSAGKSDKMYTLKEGRMNPMLRIFLLCPRTLLGRNVSIAVFGWHRRTL